MPDPIEEFARRMADYERRLHALETAPRAPFTTSVGGFTRWLASDGDDAPSVGIGAGAADEPAVWVLDDDGSGVYLGVSVGAMLVAVAGPDGDGVGRALTIYDGKMLGPLIASGWQRDGNRTVDANGRPTTTSGSYVSMANTLLPVTTGGVVTYIDVVLGGGVTSVAVKVSCRALGGGGSAETVQETTGITSTSTIGGSTWTVPDAIRLPDAGSPVGILAEFFLEARVTGGAGTIAVMARTPIVNYPT